MVLKRVKVVLVSWIKKKTIQLFVTSVSSVGYPGFREAQTDVTLNPKRGKKTNQLDQTSNTEY
jgi:hypothetical protein